MRCCRCNEEMLVVEYARVEIDYCADCGIWLDSGELDLILEETREEEGGSGETSPPSDDSRGDKPIRCPVCHRKMNKGPYDELAHSIVDRCPNEHGIWLDRGELREIVGTRKSDDTADRTAVISFLSNLFRASSETCFVVRSSEGCVSEDTGTKSPEATHRGSSRTFRAEDDGDASCSRPQQEEGSLDALRKEKL